MSKVATQTRAKEQCVLTSTRFDRSYSAHGARKRLEITDGMLVHRCLYL